MCLFRPKRLRRFILMIDDNLINGHIVYDRLIIMLTIMTDGSLNK